MIAFQRMVVHHIQNNLQPAFVKPLNHFLKIVDIGTNHIARFQSKEVQCFVSPEIVFQTGIAFRHKSIDRHQFHRRYAQPFQIPADTPACQPRKCAPLGILNFGVQFGIPFDMQFVKYRLCRVNLRRNIAFPVKIAVVHNHRLRNIRCTVKRRKRQVFVRAFGIITENRLMPDEPADKFFRIRINQQLVRIEPPPFCRLIRSVNAVAVNLSQRYPFKVNMPDVVFAHRKFVASRFLNAALVKQAQFDLCCSRRKQGKINAPFINRCSQRIRPSFPYSDIWHLPSRIFSKTLFPPAP